MYHPFELVLGEDPEKVDAAELGRFLTTISKATAIEYGGRVTPVVSLVGITAGSTRPRLQVAPPAARDACRLLAFAAGDETVKVSPEARKVIVKLADLARDYGRSAYQIESVNGYLAELGGRWTIPAAAPPPVPRISHGGTSIHGKCVRVGGDKAPKIEVRYRGKVIECVATKELCKQVTPRLYRIVGLRGEAKWDSESWEIKELKVLEVLDFDDSKSPLEAIESIGEHVGEAWAGLDIEREIRRMLDWKPPPAR